MRVRSLIAALALVATVFTIRPLAQTTGGGSFVPGEVLVKFRPGVGAAAQADAHRQNGGAVRAEITPIGLRLVTVPAGSESAAIARYRLNPNVLYAELNYVRSVPAPLSHAPGTQVLPGDYYFREQWALHNTGQLFYCLPWIFGDMLCFYIGTPDADIDAPEAWALSTGTGVPVAVIDTGIDYTHPDLAGKFIGGWDFVNGDGDPMDDHGHGTHVAGTIAAAMNNRTGDPAADEGVVGVAPDALILSYKVCTPDGHCNDFAVAQAIVRAADDHAKVINMSLGGIEFSQAMFDAVQYAWNAGLVIVAGAGNDGVTTPFYPAAFPNVIAVGAFDEDHRRAPFSNYGNWVDISAPGNVIMSSYPMSSCPATTTPGDIGCYAWNSGTSMATPHVSGAAALVWARGDLFSNQQVVNVLLNSADPRGVDPVRLDSWTVHGGLNVHNAMSYGITNAAPVANAGADRTVIDTDDSGWEEITLDGSASADPDGQIISYQWSEGETAIGSGASVSTIAAVGTHTFTLQVTDNAGATSSDTVVVTISPAPNQPPLANAGPDQAVTDTNNDGSETIILNGSGFDVDGTIVSYEWLEGSTLLSTYPSPTLALAVGTHTLMFRVHDNDGASATDSVTVRVNPYVPQENVHVSDLDGSYAVTKTSWTARVSVTVHNENHQAVADGAVLSGTWTGGAAGTGTCSTVNGTCVIVSSSMHKRVGSATFTVTGIAASSGVYARSANHDTDGSSDGTTITIAKP